MEMNLARQLGKMGRRGDNMVGHLTRGELVIPKEIIDNEPAVLASAIKAMTKHGVDWRKYMAGGEEDSVNPQTGMNEYAFGGIAGDLGSEIGDAVDAVGEADDGIDFTASNLPTTEGIQEDQYPGSVSLSVGSPDDFDISAGSLDDRSMSDQLTDLITKGQRLSPKNEGRLLMGAMTNFPGGFLVNAIPKALSAITGLPGEYAPTEEDQTSNTDEAPAVYQSPAVSQETVARDVSRPSWLNIPLGLTPTQQRAYIATQGTQGGDPRYRDAQTMAYYRSLLQQALTDGGEPLPIEHQYLRQMGLAYNSTPSLLEAIAAA